MRECAEEEDCLLAAGVSAPPADCLLVAGVSWPGAGAGAAMLPVLWRLGVRGLLLLWRSISLVTVQLLHQLLTYQLLPAVSSHSCSWSRSPRPGTCCRWRSGHWSQAGSHWSLVSGHSCGSRGGGGGRLGLASRSLASLPRYTAHMGPGLGRWRSNISVRGDGVCMFVTLARDRRMRRTATWHQRWHRYHCPARTGHWGRNLCLDTHPR